MNVVLPLALRRYVDSQVESGRYLDASEVVRAALRQMETKVSMTWETLGAMNGQDIEAIAFLVLMAASKSAQEDLKAIMAHVKAINAEKEGWRQVLCTMGKYGVACASERDDFKASTARKAIPQGSAASIAKKPIGAGVLDGKHLVFNIPGPNGAAAPGRLAIAGSGQPGGYVTKKDIDSAWRSIKDKLDSLNEMGEMESLRLQIAMDRLSKMMSTLSNLLKRLSETASSITQNIK